METKIYVIAWATIYDALVLTDMLTFPPFEITFIYTSIV